MSKFTKDPTAVLDWTFDWSGWLAQGETIAASSAVVPAGLSSTASAHNTTTHTVWLSGGTPGVIYKVTSRVTTSAGRVDARSIVVHVDTR